LKLARDHLSSYSNLSSWTDHDLLRYYRGYYYNTTLALEAIQTTLEWRQRQRIDTILEFEDFSDLESTGKLMFAGQTNEGKPLLIWRGCLHYPGKTPIESQRTIRYFIWKLEKAKAKG